MDGDDHGMGGRQHEAKSLCECKDSYVVSLFWVEVEIQTLNLRLTDMSEDEVKKQLADEELESLKLGGVVLHETGPGAFLEMGLVLEETQ